jgi:hypothetical protein
MAKFNILNAAENAYRTSWGERRYLLRLAIVPFFLKLICYSLAFSMGYQEDYLRLTLFLLPALFAEGWMLSHYTRLIVLGHRWPFVPTGNMQEDIKTISVRARGVMGGLIVYVLINMALGAILAFVTPLVPSEPTTAEQLPPATGFLFFALLIFSFWGFRLTWLYIPYALNIDAARYLKTLGGFAASIPLIGTWFLCFLPFMIFVQIIGAVLTPLLGSAGGFAIVIVMVAADILKNILATAAITYGLIELFGENK